MKTELLKQVVSTLRSNGQETLADEVEQSQSDQGQEELWEEMQILLDDFAIPKNVLELVKYKFHITRK